MQTSNQNETPKIDATQEHTDPIHAEQIKTVKGQGFLHNRGTRNFSARIITENGILTNQQMNIVAEAARKFGNGNVALTVRLTMEVQGIPYEKIPDIIEFIESNGLAIGGTGPRVRPVVSCKGTTCNNGLCDTATLGTVIHKRFYEGYRQVTLPHKFKIAAGGCPNNCVKPDLNDVGIVAIRKPRLIDEKCRGCSKCNIIETCPSGAASLVNKKLQIDTSICNSCGKCVNKCYFSALESPQTQYKVYVGGRWGKKTRHGSLLSQIVSETEALDIIEKTILLFKKEGKSRERFSDTVERLGEEYVESILYSSQLLEEKNAILNGDITGGISC